MAESENIIINFDVDVGGIENRIDKILNGLDAGFCGIKGEWVKYKQK